MKKRTKILLVSGVALLLSVGAVINFLKAAQTETTVSDLTLANIEALALDKQENFPMMQGPSYKDSHRCSVCKTYHVLCRGKEHGGDCIPIHCLL